MARTTCDRICIAHPRRLPVRKGGDGERLNAIGGSSVIASLEVGKVAAIQMEWLRVWSRVRGGRWWAAGG